MLLSPFTDEENQVQIQVLNCCITMPRVPGWAYLATVAVKLVVEVQSSNIWLLFSYLTSGMLRQAEQEESYKDSGKQRLKEGVITTPNQNQDKGTRAEAGQPSETTGGSPT